jgi:hypothetical protein
MPFSPDGWNFLSVHGCLVLLQPYTVEIRKKSASNLLANTQPVRSKVLLGARQMSLLVSQKRKKCARIFQLLGISLIRGAGPHCTESRAESGLISKDGTMV